jgi:hypothetical protein
MDANRAPRYFLSGGFDSGAFAPSGPFESDL